MQVLVLRASQGHLCCRRRFAQGMHSNYITEAILTNICQTIQGIRDFYESIIKAFERIKEFLDQLAKYVNHRKDSAIRQYAVDLLCQVFLFLGALAQDAKMDSVGE